MRRPQLNSTMDRRIVIGDPARASWVQPWIHVAIALAIVAGGAAVAWLRQ